MSNIEFDAISNPFPRYCLRLSSRRFTSIKVSRTLKRTSGIRRPNRALSGVDTPDWHPIISPRRLKKARRRMTMAEFRVIDADSHVEEPEEAWGYLDQKYE